MEDLTGLARRLRSSSVPAPQGQGGIWAGGRSGGPPPPSGALMNPRQAAMLGGGGPAFRRGGVSPAGPAAFGMGRGISPEGSELSIRDRGSPSPLPAMPLAPVRAPLSRRGGGLVVPAIFGVGAAIGTIQFGAGAFPNLFKGRDGKVDRNKVNLGGLAAGALVFLIARHVLS
eukprot:jgi/Mesvir1/24201/Mv10917-RA.1